MNRLAISIIVLLLGTPALALEGTTKWTVFRDIFLKEGRSDLMEFCGEARMRNAQGTSYWGVVVPEMRKRMIERGNPEDGVRSFYSGLAAAMAVVCPDVW